MTEKEFCSELLENLTGNILPYWIDKMIDPRGGFYGRRDGFDRLDEDAPKGAILNGRLLWSFASAYRTTGRQEYLDIATRAKDYILKHFVDHEYGGVYWSLNADGTPLDTKKQFYAIGFVIYGLTVQSVCFTTSRHIVATVSTEVTLRRVRESGGRSMTCV